MEAVLVINADLGPLHRVSLRHAIRMLIRQVAVVHDGDPEDRIGHFPKPRVVRLVQYIATKWRFTAGPGWSRTGVLNRDNRRCGYCPNQASTVDHVHPQSRGGRNTWTNTVAACDPCNQRKGDRTPVEAGMVLRVQPFAPTWASLSR